jgi:hypothetical protein
MIETPYTSGDSNSPQATLPQARVHDKPSKTGQMSVFPGTFAISFGF